jgi:FG-GAP repeat protein
MLMNTLLTLVLASCSLMNLAHAQQGAYSVKVDGGNAGDHFGYTMGVCSDSFLSADGLPDIIVGAPDQDWGGAASGRLTWYSLDGAVAVEVDRIDGATGQRWGKFFLESGVDFDGDGWDEVLYNYSSSGRELSGSFPHSVIQNFSFYEDYLFVVGDFDNDGVNDIGSFFDASSSSYDTFLVYSGANPSTTLLSYPGPTNASSTGFQACPAGDLDKDGFEDLVVIEANADNQWIRSTGCLYALAGDNPGFGGREIWKFYGEKNNDRLESVVNVGDWDGDFVDDFAVGSPGVDVGALTDAGRIYFVSGATGLEIDRLDGFATGLAMGASRRLAAGDITGDGRAELLVGLPAYDPNSMTDAGAVRVYEWDGGALQLLFGYDGDNAGDQFGFDIDFGNDLTGDGIADFLASSPYADPNGYADAGSVFVFSGNAGGGPVITAPGTASPGTSFPVDLANARPSDLYVLLGSPSDLGSQIFGAYFEIGLPTYVVAVGGAIPLTGRMTVDVNVPKPFPGGSPSRIYLEGLLFDPYGTPFDAVSSTNMTSVLVQ